MQTSMVPESTGSIKYSITFINAFCFYSNHWYIIYIQTSGDNLHPLNALIHGWYLYASYECMLLLDSGFMLEEENSYRTSRSQTLKHRRTFRLPPGGLVH